MKNKKSTTRKAAHNDKRKKINKFEKKEMSKQVIRAVQKGKLYSKKKGKKTYIYKKETSMSKKVTEK